LDERILFRSMPDILFDLFLRTRNRSRWQARTARPPPRPCWRGSSSRRQGTFFSRWGDAENFGSSFALRQGKHFIIEGDEYDTAFFDKGPKFLHYFPEAVILTSVEFDHADIYSNLGAVKTAFKRLVNLVPRRGKINCL